MHSHTRPRTALRCILIAMAAAAACAQAHAIDLTRITPIGTAAYTPHINNAGVIAGTASLGSTSKPFIYSGGTLQSLGISGQVYGLGEGGQVLGWTDSVPGGARTAFLHDATGTHILNLNESGTTGSTMVTDITDQGVLLGVLRYEQDVILQYGGNGSTTVLQTLPLKTGIRDLSNDGTKMAGVDATSGAVKAWIERDGVREYIPTFGQQVYRPAAINNHGVAAGVLETTDEWGSTASSIFFYDSQTDAITHVAPGVRGWGKDINESGEIVGSYFNDSGESAFLYKPGIGLVDLNALLPAALQSRWKLISATSINDGRQIVGYGTYDGFSTSFLLTNITAVPEPDGWLMVLAGAGVVGWGARRRR